MFRDVKDCPNPDVTSDDIDGTIAPMFMICTCCLFRWASPVVTASPYGK